MSDPQFNHSRIHLLTLTLETTWAIKADTKSIKLSALNVRPAKGFLVRIKHH